MRFEYLTLAFRLVRGGHERPLLADSSRSRKGRHGPRTTIKIPTQTSESLTFSAVMMRPIVHLVAQHGDSGLAT